MIMITPAPVIHLLGCMHVGANWSYFLHCSYYLVYYIFPHVCLPPRYLIYIVCSSPNNEPFFRLPSGGYRKGSHAAQLAHRSSKVVSGIADQGRSNRQRDIKELWVLLFCVHNLAFCTSKLVASFRLAAARCTIPSILTLVIEWTRKFTSTTYMSLAALMSFTRKY